MKIDASLSPDRWTAHLGDYPPGRFAGAGIVICAGGAAMFTNAYVLLHVLRHALGCRLPIEVWHLGPDELSPRMRGLLQELDVTCIDGLAVKSGMARETIDGWRLKALALMESSFSKVLLLDADQTPTRDPAEVFEWREFIRTGAVLWPDILDLDRGNPIWELCGLAPEGRVSIESGQLLIDKERHWSAIQIALRLNEAAHEVYQFVYGDKDTFLIGLLMAGSEFSLVPTRPGVDRGRCLYQHDFDGDVLFQHRTGAKWRYRGTQDGLTTFQHEKACLAALEALRQKWNGLIFIPPERSPAARAQEDALCASRELVFIAPGEEPRVLELLQDGEIGRGRASDALNWYCREDEGLMRLVLRDSFSERWLLTREAGGRWSGYDLIDPSVEACAATGVTVAARSAPLRFKHLWEQWPRSGFYRPPDAGLL